MNVEQEIAELRADVRELRALVVVGLVGEARYPRCESGLPHCTRFAEVRPNERNGMGGVYPWLMCRACAGERADVAPLAGAIPPRLRDLYNAALERLELVP